jgi:serine/threonine protein kinase
MPLEYVIEGQVSQKTDIWSLGCLMFYIFTNGVEPWSSVKNFTGMVESLENKVSFFADVKGKTEEDVKSVRDVLEACLVHEKEKRKSVVEINDKLRGKIEELRGKES